MTDYSRTAEKSTKPESNETAITPVQGKTTVKKKSAVRRFAEELVAEDIGNIKDYAIHKVIIPSLRNGINNGFNALIDYIFGGGDDFGPVTKSRTAGPYRDYTKPGQTRGYSKERMTQSTISCDEITYESRGEAEYVLRALNGNIDQYGQCTVIDLYELSKVTPEQYWTQAKYGWVSLKNARIIETREGFTLKLPKPYLLDD